jgi:hypothetical protein
MRLAGGGVQPPGGALPVAGHVPLDPADEPEDGGIEIDVVGARSRVRRAAAPVIYPSRCAYDVADGTGALAARPRSRYADRSIVTAA